MRALPERIFLVFLFVFSLFAEISRASVFAQGEQEIKPEYGAGWTMQVFWAEADEEFEEENEKVTPDLIFDSGESDFGWFFRKFDFHFLLSEGEESVSSLCFPLLAGRLFLHFAGVLQI